MNAIEQVVALKGSLKDAAKALGISAPYASLLRSGHRNMTVDIAKGVGKITGKPWHKYL